MKEHRTRATYMAAAPRHPLLPLRVPACALTIALLCLTAAGAKAGVEAGAAAGEEAGAAAPAAAPGSPGEQPGPGPEATETTSPLMLAAAFRSTVSARRFQPEEGTTFPQEVLGEEAEQLPLIDSDLYRSLHLAPGVQADDYTARFSLRGGEHEDLLTLVDGMPLYDPFHLQDYGGAISILGLDLVESTTLLGDGFPARFGDRMGGVIEVQTKRPGTCHEGSAGFDLLNAHAFARGPLGEQGGYLFAARRGYIDLFLDAWARDVDFRPSYWDIFAKLERRIGERDRLALYGLWAADSNRIGREGDRPDLSSNHANGMAWGRWERTLPGGGMLAAALAYGHASRDKQEGSLGRDLRTIDHLLAQQDWTLPLGGDRGTLRWGGRLRWCRGEYDYAMADLADLARPERTEIAVRTEAQGLQGSAYLQHDSRPFSWLQTTLGIRADRLQGVDSWNPGPRLALALFPQRKLTLRAAWGMYHQPITPHELPVEAGLSEAVPAEQAEHRVVGLLWQPGRWLHLRLEGYWRTYDRLVGLLPDMGREERVYLLPDQARCRGVEVEARGFPRGSRMGWLVGYTLSQAEEWVADGAPHPRPGDRTHALTGGLDLDLGAVGHLALVYRYHSGVPYTPAIAVAPATEGSPPRLVYGEPGSGRLPPFHSLDARLSREWSWDRWALHGYVQVMNATLRDNVHEYVHEIEQQGERAVVVRRTEGFFPILPSLGIEGRWR
ncbi:MAG: hypothetical protein FJ125_09930 [Deltaproteobacteria bacterium]|nr:hypothetical protein [Deltaproteobacteria bacterium]